MNTTDTTTNTSTPDEPERPVVVCSIATDELPDPDPDLSFLRDRDYSYGTLEEAGRHRATDRARLAAFERGDVCMIGIRAEAEITVRVGPNHAVTQTIASGGLWGIESDSRPDYLDSIRAEQIDELCDILRILGCAESNITNARPAL